MCPRNAVWACGERREGKLREAPGGWGWGGEVVYRMSTYFTLVISESTGQPYDRVRRGDGEGVGVSLKGGLGLCGGGGL